MRRSTQTAPTQPPQPIPVEVKHRLRRLARERAAAHARVVAAALAVDAAHAAVADPSARTLRSAVGLLVPWASSEDVEAAATAFAPSQQARQLRRGAALQRDATAQMTAQQAEDLLQFVSAPAAVTWARRDARTRRADHSPGGDAAGVYVMWAVFDARQLHAALLRHFAKSPLRRYTTGASGQALLELLENCQAAARRGSGLIEVL